MIKGTITKIFVQKDNDWGVYNLEDIYGRTVKTVGIIPGASIGMTVTIEEKEEYTKWGKQYTIQSVLAVESDKYAAIRRFLSDGYVKGCKESTANLVIEFFGDDTEKVLFSDNSTEQLVRVKGIGPAKAQSMAETAKENRKYLDILKFTGGSVTKDQADKMINRYGARVLSVLKNNPYRLIMDIKGFGFKKADSIAEGCGIKKNSIKRIEAGITYVLNDAADSDGDCYLYRGDIEERIGELLTTIPRITDKDITSKMAKFALKTWDNGGKDKFIKAHKPSQETIDALDDVNMQKKSIEKSLDKALASAIKRGDLVEEGMKIFTKEMHDRECFIADLISGMLHGKPVRKVTDRIVADSVARIEKEKSAQLAAEGKDSTFEVTDEQKQAVERSLSKRVSVITGGPGRGKTTIIEVIVDAFLHAGKNDKDDIIMLAPTGRAAQRIKEQTGFDASTIHRGIFRYEGGKPQVQPSPKGKLIIVDESSMIDIYLLKSLVEFAQDSQIIFVGDVDQIASVGPGKCLKDLIASEVIPTSFLIKGHRNTGSIANNSVLINRGREIKSYTYDSHFVYIPSDIDHLQQTIVNDYIRKTNEYGIKNVLLCVAMRERGRVSVNILNVVLQDIFTKGHKQAKVGQNIFREGDRVMQTKNNYGFVMKRGDKLEQGVFNGEKGTIVRIGADEDGDPTFVVAFDDGSFGGYTSKSATGLTLAYATTVHKCQGSESPCVMMAYTYGDFMLLKRSLFYTGETRAQKEFRFYGEEQFRYGRMLSAFDIAVKKVDDKERNTMLAERIKQAAGKHGKLTA